MIRTATKTAEALPSGAKAPRGTWLLWAYALVSLINISAVLLQEQWLIYLTKPSLMLWLLLYVALNTQHAPSTKRYLALGALLMSSAGDTWLMLEGTEQTQALFFLLGLGSFLLTQLGYTWLFSLTTGFREGLLARQPIMAAPLLFYWVLLITLLWPGMPAGMRVPVMIYGLVITSMALSAYNLRPLLSKRIYLPLLVGVLLFLCSDSLIGLSKFRPDIGPIWQPRLLIMTTYLVGQYLIARQLVHLVNRHAPLRPAA